jgi:uncharacterized protein YndB with AHSA1/START domain
LRDFTDANPQTRGHVEVQQSQRKEHQMIQFVIETDIARPPASVFEYVTDPGKLATWQTSTVSAVAETPGPIGLGSRLREVHRAPGGKELASLVEVSEFERDRVFALHMLDGALPLDGRLTFEPHDDGTRLRFAVLGEPSGMLRLAAPVMRPVLRRQFAGYCDNLKRILENGSP